MKHGLWTKSYHAGSRANKRKHNTPPNNESLLKLPRKSPQPINSTSISFAPSTSYATVTSLGSSDDVNINSTQSRPIQPFHPVAANIQPIAGNSLRCTIRAAVRVIAQNSVFCVSNVSTDYTVSDTVKHCLYSGVLFSALIVLYYSKLIDQHDLSRSRSQWEINRTS